jgi:hypothetical protein
MTAWAVISVQDLPDFAVPGRSFALVFSVTQHGVKLLGDLSPTVAFTSGDDRRGVPGVATGEEEMSRATVDFPRPGDRTVIIHPGFGSSRVTLAPVTAIQIPRAPPSLLEEERGCRLFVAKGCVTRHAHVEVVAVKSWNMRPELTGWRDSEVQLRQRLTDPKSVIPMAKMPNLHFRMAEIAPITTFVNLERQATN